MDVNTITLDQPAGPKASNTPRGGDRSFQFAYAKVLGKNYAPVGRGGAPAHPPRWQDSPPPPDLTAHTVRAGDTLYGIARARLATIGVEANARAAMQGAQQLAQANNIRNPDRIYVGQKLNLAGLESSFGRSQTASPAGIDSSATAASGIKQQHQWRWEEPVTEDDAPLEAEEAADFPVTIPELTPAMLTLVFDDAAAEVDAGTQLAARQVALYEQNASIAPGKPAEPARALPDIVYKGVVGKVLDAMPLEPSTRTALQKANTIIGSAFTARSLGALTGLGGPLLTVAGLIWGIFSARQIEAAAARESKATRETKPVGDPKPAGDAMQTAQNKPSEALD